MCVERKRSCRTTRYRRGPWWPCLEWCRYSWQERASRSSVQSETRSYFWFWMWNLTPYTTSHLHARTPTCIKKHSRKRKINSDQYSLSWVPVCTSLPCGQHLDQTRWQDGNSRRRPGNKQFVLQNQWGRVSLFLSQDRPSRSWLASKTPTVCTSYWKPPQESRDRDWRVLLRTDYMTSLIWFAALLPLTAVTILSVVRLDSNQGTETDSLHWISLATTTHPERFLSTFYTTPNVKPGVLPHLKWKLLVNTAQNYLLLKSRISGNLVPLPQ